MPYAGIMYLRLFLSQNKYLQIVGSQFKIKKTELQGGTDSLQKWTISDCSTSVPVLNICKTILALNINIPMHGIKYK